LFYHLDTGHRLKEGLNIDISESKNSIFGVNYAIKFLRYNVADSLKIGNLNASLGHLDAATFREYALEFFRLHHPSVRDLNLPSRLSSFFATNSVEDAVRYAERNEYRREVRIFEVHAEGIFHSLDMTWLDREFPKQINSSTAYYWHKYWTGELFEKDPDLAKADQRSSLCEVLITSPLTVGRRVA
jgi:hypothetical protein